MPSCAAIHCKNVGIHIFPNDTQRRKLWERALRRENWKSSEKSMLCSAHFKCEDYIFKNPYTDRILKRKLLKKTAVPSIFSFTDVKTVNPLANQQSQLITNVQKLRSNALSADQVQVPGSSDIQIIFGDDFTIKIEPVDPLAQVPGTSESHKPRILVDSKSTQVNFTYGSIERHKHSNVNIKFYTGFNTYAKFNFVFSTLSPNAYLIKYQCNQVKNVPIDIEDQFFMTMMKLRQNTCDFELSLFFGVCLTAVDSIVTTWINFMDEHWKKLGIFPEDLVQCYMQDHFKEYDKNLIFLSVDGKEIKNEKPRKLKYQPANKGYNTLIEEKGQIPSIKLLKGNKFSNKRIHIERLLGFMKTYKILKRIPKNLAALQSKMFFVCLMCCSFNESKCSKIKV